MEALTTIPPEVAALIPVFQLKCTRENVREYINALQGLKTQLEKCPKIGETEKMKEHPAIFHYFGGNTDIFISEFDGVNTMFGYSILNGDLDNSEWGFFSLSELTTNSLLSVDYRFPDDNSIEEILYCFYPRHFPKPEREPK